MRMTATLLAVVVASGCASRQSAPTTGVSRYAAPVNYETTVTTYFDLFSSAPPAQRKLVFGVPETTNCGVAGSSRGHLGWVVPVNYETRPPPPSSVPAKAVVAAPLAAELPVRNGKTVATASKGKTKGPSKAAVANKAVVSPLAAPRPAAVVAAAEAADPVTPSNAKVVALDKVTVTGNVYFFWFNKEMINAVTRRMDICP
jgi:hypothetical protein